MKRPRAKRRGGAAHITIAYVFVGAASAGLLAAGPRQLGHEAFNGLAIAWSISTVFGLGLAGPIELLRARRMNVGTNTSARPISVLWIVALVTVIGVVSVAPSLKVSHAFGPLAWSSVLGLFGWACLAIVRSKLGGAGDLAAYALVLMAEAVSRAALVVLSFTMRNGAQTLLGLAVGAPLLIAACAGVAFNVVDAPKARTPPPTVRGEAAAFVAVSLGYQLCLSAPALLVAWRSGSTNAVVGQFVAASSYFRVPTVLMGGLATHALVELSHAWGEFDEVGFRRALRSAVRAAGWASGLSTAALSGLAPALLSVYYGARLTLSVDIYAALAVSSVIAILAAVVSQAALALGDGRYAAVSWLLGAAITLAVIAFSSGIDSLSALALIAGPSAALAGIAVAVHRGIGDRFLRRREASER